MKNKVKLNKQYGIVNKNILQNKNISIKAKGLYVYLCARSGNKGYCTPSVATICNDLGITDNTFFKYKNELVKANIIKVTKEGTGIKQRNIYHLPKVSKGYGIVYLDTLKDNSINLQGKAIYGLLACYAGARFIAYPLAKLIYSYLKVSRNTYFKILKVLKTKGIVRTKQLHINGRYAYCNYYINGAKPNKTNTKYIVKFKSNNKRKASFNAIKINSNKCDDYNLYRDMVLSNISYKALVGYFSKDKYALTLLDNIIDILVNSLYVGCNSLTYKGIRIAASSIKSIYRKLEFSHIKSVIMNVKGVTNKIYNKTEYLRVCLVSVFYNN